jgi:hypothetical protein
MYVARSHRKAPVTDIKLNSKKFLSRFVSERWKQKIVGIVVLRVTQQLVKLWLHFVLHFVQSTGTLSVEQQFFCLLVYYGTYGGFRPTFRDYISFPSLRVKHELFGQLDSLRCDIGSPETSVSNHRTPRNNPEDEFSSSAAKAFNHSQCRTTFTGVGKHGILNGAVRQGGWTWGTVPYGNYQWPRLMF